MTDSDYAEELGRRLRAARHHRGMSLVEVQLRSAGRWTPGTLGAYERGNRSLRVQRLVELAELYEVPATLLLPKRADLGSGEGLPPVVIDLARLRRLPPTRTGPLRRWLAIVQVLRNDHSRNVLKLRRTDLHALSRLYSTAPLPLYERFEAWGALAEPSPPVSGAPRPGTATGAGPARSGRSPRPPTTSRPGVPGTTDGRRLTGR
ncbi:MAG: transcriptional regulator [Frankia sp.]